VLGSNPSWDTGYLDRFFFCVFPQPSSQILGKYWSMATTASFQILFNSSFISHSTIRRCSLDTESIYEKYSQNVVNYSEILYSHVLSSHRPLRCFFYCCSPYYQHIDVSGYTSVVIKYCLCCELSANISYYFLIALFVFNIVQLHHFSRFFIDLFIATVFPFRNRHF
jgi:hypothetical protein